MTLNTLVPFIIVLAIFLDPTRHESVPRVANAYTNPTHTFAGSSFTWRSASVMGINSKEPSPGQDRIAFHMNTQRETTRNYLANLPSMEGEDNSNIIPASNNAAPAKNETDMYLESISTPKGFLPKLKRIIGRTKSKMKFDKAEIGKMGVDVALAYGFVSNVCGCLAVSVAWFVFSNQTGLSPLAPGQKPKFLAVYAGFFAFLNVIRPARFAFSVYLSRYFDRARKALRRKFNVSPQTATGLVVFFFNFCGSCALMALGVAVASALSGVPVWAK